MSSQDSYAQGQLTFINIDRDYGADTQGLDYNYQFSPSSQAKTQTQASQLTHSGTQTVIV